MDRSWPPVKRWLEYRKHALLIGIAIGLSLTATPAAGKCQKVVVARDASCLYSYVECNLPVEETYEEVTRTIYKPSLDVVIAGADTNALKDDRSGFPPCIVKVPQRAHLVNLPCCPASSDSPSHILASCDQIGLSSTVQTTWYKTDANGVPQKYKANIYNESCLDYMPSGGGNPSPATTQPLSPATTQPLSPATTQSSSTPIQPPTGTPPAWPPLWPPFPWPSSPPRVNSNGEGSKGSQPPCSRSLRLHVTHEQAEGMYMCSMKVLQPSNQSASATWTKRRFIVSRDKPLDTDDTPVSPIDCYTVNILLPPVKNTSGGEETISIYKPKFVSVAKETKVCLHVINPAGTLKWFYNDNIGQVSVGLQTVSQSPSKSLVSSTLPGIGIAGLKREMVMIEEMQKQFQGTFGFTVKQPAETQAGIGEDAIEPSADGDLTLLVKVELKEDEPSSAKKFHDALYAAYVFGGAVLALAAALIGAFVHKRLNKSGNPQERIPVQVTDKSNKEAVPLLTNTSQPSLYSQ